MSDAATVPHQGPQVIDERDGLYVLYKPCGVPVHATQAHDGQDLMSRAIKELRLPQGLSPIHRLDIETSGLVLCSASAEVRGHFGYMFQQHQATKRYWALVFGHTHKKGLIKQPLQDSRRGKALEAVSRYKQLERFRGCTLLEVRPETGRKHQIRRHLQGLGHPIIGDERYKPKRFIAVPAFPGRLWLHAHSLELEGLGLSWRCPLPAELAEHLEALRIPSSD